MWSTRAAAGQFHVYAVETIDQAVELLTGMPAGSVDTEGSLDQRVAQRLLHLAELRRKYAKQSRSDSSERHQQNDG
jgi:predicted ATP-dependent protease